MQEGGRKGEGRGGERCGGSEQEGSEKERRKAREILEGLGRVERKYKGACSVLLISVVQMSLLLLCITPFPLPIIYFPA